MITKQLTAVELTVDVTIEDMPDDVYRFTSICGETTAVNNHTIGAASGEIGDYDAASLEAELDERAAYFADAVARREKLRIAKESLKTAAALARASVPTL